MFKLESYITPIILNHVAKYVKNIRPQDSQVSLWEGEVAFQNLDLRLDVLEEELQLPFEFLSGHIHELTIRVPWTKITSEPINITINTIEFVLKLKDQNADVNLTKQERKKRPSKVEEPQQGYIPGLVSKIINNITIDCHNIILKYVEDDIVVSMNIQLLSLSSADNRWQKAFADVNPLKMILRKLVQVSDLTICLDKRNQIGQIEVCQEPILYKCSLEIRILRKYNAATASQSSSTVIHIFSKAVDINVSSLQFPMAMRLVALVMALKSGELKSISELDVANENAEDSEGVANVGESYLSWAWNLLPNILATEPDSDEVDNCDGHFMDIGVYIEQLRLSLKFSEFVLDSIVQTTKKIRYNPILRVTLKGIYSETLISDQKWFNTRAGVSSILVEPLGAYNLVPGNSFVTTPNEDLKTFLTESLFDQALEDSSNFSKKYITDLNDHTSWCNESYLLYRSPALAFDMVHVSEDTLSDTGSSSSSNNPLEKLLIRAFMSSTTFEVNSSLFGIVDTLQTLAATYNYPPYVPEKKSDAIPSKLPPPSMDEYDALMASDIPKRELEIVLLKINVVLHSLQRPGSPMKPAAKKLPNSSIKNLPKFVLRLERSSVHWMTPINPNPLVFTTCQLPKKPPELLSACYDTFTVKIRNVGICLDDTLETDCILQLPYAIINFGAIIQPERWKSPQDVLYKLDAKVENIILSFTRPQLIVCLHMTNNLLNFNDSDVVDLCASSARRDIHERSFAKVEKSLTLLNVTARKFPNALCCSGNIKYGQVCLVVPQHCDDSEEKSFLFRAPVDVPLHVSESFCNYYVQIQTDLEDQTMQPIIAVNISDYVLIFDPILRDFLDYKEVAVDTDQQLDHSVIADVVSRGDRSKASSHAAPSQSSRKVVNPEETIHLSSEKGEKIEIKPKGDDHQQTTSKDISQILQLKSFALHIEINTGSFYMPSQAKFLSISSIISPQTQENSADYVNVSLPHVILKSAVSEPWKVLNNLEWPKVIRKKFIEDTFPWTCDIMNFDMSTLVQGELKQVVNEFKTSVTVAMNHKTNTTNSEVIAFNIYVDTTPVHIEFREKETHFLLERINSLRETLTLLTVRKTSAAPCPRDVEIYPEREDDSDIKEFLAMKSESQLSIYTDSSKQKEVTDAPIPFFSIWFQWTVAKFKFDILSSSHQPKKLEFEVEDFIISVDQQLEYLKIKNKIGTISANYYEYVNHHWTINDCIKLTVPSEASKAGETFFDLIITQAETIDVFNKLGTQKNSKNLQKSLTEIVANIQVIDFALDLEHFCEFIPVIFAFQSNQNTEQNPGNLVSVADLPLLYFECKGITLYTPVHLNDDKKSVFIFKVGKIQMSPNVENPLNRITVRPDIYNKAAQLRMLHTPGSKVEDRQYEIVIKDISTATGNWVEISSFLRKDETINFHNTNPAVEWNNQQGNKPSPNVRDIFRNFVLSITYAPCIVYKNILISGQAIEFNCLTDLVVSVTNEEISTFGCIAASLSKMNSLLSSQNMEEQEMDSGSQSQTAIIEASNCDESDEKKHKNTVRNIKKFTDLSRKGCFKDSSKGSFVKYVGKGPYADSGIASYYTNLCDPENPVGFENDFKETRRGKKSPSEVSFVAGVFIFKLLVDNSYKDKWTRKKSTTDQDLEKSFVPLLTCTLKQPSMLMSQKVTELSVQFSIFNLSVALNGFKQSDSSPDTKNELKMLIQTEPGPATLSGITPPLLLMKLSKSLYDDIQIDCSLLRPTIVHCSHVILERLGKLSLIVQDSLLNIPREEAITEKPIPRGTKIEKIRNMMFNASRVNMFIEKFILNSQASDYLINLSLTEFGGHLKFIDRPEKMHLRTTCKGIFIDMDSKSLLHPVNFSTSLKFCQESWSNNPIIVAGIKVNVVHVDIGTENIKVILKAVEHYQVSLKRIDEEQTNMEMCLSADASDSDRVDRTKLEMIPVPKVVRQKKTKVYKDEFYQDDLRAGAFQFIICESDCELPLPYQIQIILKNNGVICWRYPQPRRINNLQIFPIPMETNKPLHIRCRMEYFSDAHEKFLHFCDFHISETETSTVDIPKRPIMANIWRVVILQSFVIVNGQYFECACSSEEEDEDEEDSSYNISIADALNESKKETEFRLNPKALVACMRVNTSFNPTFIPTIQAVLHCNLIQLNVQNQFGKDPISLPHSFDKFNLSTNYFENHTFATLSISDLTLYGGKLADHELISDVELSTNLKVLDYGYLNMLYAIEDTKLKVQLDHGRNVELNTTVDLLKVNVGLPILQTLLLSVQHWRRSLRAAKNTAIFFTRYLICNRTNVVILFGQVNTKDKLSLKPQEISFYSFRQDYQDQKLVFSTHMGDQVCIRSDPVSIDDEGIQYIRIAENVLILNVTKLSAPQICVDIRGQVEMVSMAPEELRIQLHVTGKSDAAADADLILKGNGKTSICTKLMQTTELTMRMKFAGPGKGWTGEVPLRSNKSLPWLVKVPQSGDKYLSYWIRVIRESIPEVTTNNFIPHRVLVIIWPLFVIRSMLTSDVCFSESTTKSTFELPSRGEQLTLSVPGNHETEHEIEFLQDIAPGHEGSSRKAKLTFKTIDWTKFFAYDKNHWTLERAIEELDSQSDINWPCSSEEELQIHRSSPCNAKTTPTFRYRSTEGFSCSLLLEISSWCLFINSLGSTIEIQNISNSDNILTLNSNQISMLCAIPVGFTIAVQLNSILSRSDPVYFSKPPADEYDRSSKQILNETGNCVVYIKSNELISKYLLQSSIENSYRIIKLSSLFILANFSKHSLSFLAFCIASGEIIKKSIISNVSTNYFNNVPNNTDKKFYKGTPIDFFFAFNAKYKPRSPNTELSYYICIKLQNGGDISVPIPLSKPMNRKCFSLQDENGSSIPLAASIVEHHGQFFVNIYDDPCPALLVKNYTNLNFYIAQTESSDVSKFTEVASECDKNFSSWYQELKANSELFYSPPNMYKHFPAIESQYASVAVALMNAGNESSANEDSLQWSKPIRTDINFEKYFKIPLHNDVKFVVCDKHKVTRICIFYTDQSTVFCVKDLRQRLITTHLENKTTTGPGSDVSKLLETKTRSPKMSSISTTDNLLADKSECVHRTLKKVVFNMFIKEISLNFFVDSKEKKYLKTDVISFYVDDLIVQYSEDDRKLNLVLSNFQIDNQLFSTGNYDFPVIVCPEEVYKKISEMPLVHNLVNEIQKSYKMNPLLSINVKLYDEEYAIESIHVSVKPIRAYVEDTYLNELLDYLLECNPQNIIYTSSKRRVRHEIPPGVVLLPKEVVNQVLILGEPLRLKSIGINPMSVLISVHTCMRLYIALDHSPLEFSAYEKKDVITLPMKFGYALGMHYLSGALFGAGWVVGSLEILGSPSGLARSFSIGLRDFVSMPVQGLMRGPWGFVVGITQGSASLLRNVTAGTVNSVSKLAASVARNLDRLTLDDEHFQRTEALRRSRPQGFTEGLSQGLTGFGISLLGAVGGLARHPLEARSPVQVVTGVGKGLVGAFAKPISGAAELVALTGQGVLHTVGFNAMPRQRFPVVTRNTSAGAAEFKIAKLIGNHMLADDIFFFHEVTANSAGQFRQAIICATNSMFAVLDVEKDELLEVIPIHKVEILLDPDDSNLLNVFFLLDNQDEGEEQSFTNQRIINYLKSNEELSTSRNTLADLRESPTTVKKRKLEWSFYTTEYLGQHLLNYLKILTKTKTNSTDKFKDQIFNKKAFD